MRPTTFHFGPSERLLGYIKLLNNERSADEKPVALVDGLNGKRSLTNRRYCAGCLKRTKADTCAEILEQ